MRRPLRAGSFCALTIGKVLMDTESVRVFLFYLLASLAALCFASAAILLAGMVIVDVIKRKQSTAHESEQPNNQ